MIARGCLTNAVHLQHLLLCSNAMTFTPWVGLLSVESAGGTGRTKVKSSGLWVFLSCCGTKWSTARKASRGHVINKEYWSKISGKIPV